MGDPMRTLTGAVVTIDPEASCEELQYRTLCQSRRAEAASFAFPFSVGFEMVGGQHAGNDFLMGPDRQTVSNITSGLPTEYVWSLRATYLRII